MRFWVRGWTTILLVMVAIGAGAESAYTVKPGETLFSIARERLGDVTRWREIFEMNRDKLENADQVRADMVLRLPDARPAGTPAASAPTAATTPAAARPAAATTRTAALVHVLQAEETLGSVALKYLGAASRWTEIYELNKDRIADPNRVQAGTVLRLPPGAVRPTATASAQATAVPVAASAPAAMTVPTPTPVAPLSTPAPSASPGAPSAAAAAMAASGATSPAGASEPAVRPISDAELRRTVDAVVADDNARAAADAEARAEAERVAAAREAAAREAAAREAAAQEEAVRQAAAREAAAQEAAARERAEVAARDAAAREAAVREAAEREAVAQEEARREAARREEEHRAAAARMAAGAPAATQAPLAPEQGELRTRDAEARSTWEEAQRELAAARARSGQAPSRPEVQVSYAPQNPAAPETRGTQGENAAVAAEANRQAAYNATPVASSTATTVTAATNAATPSTTASTSVSSTPARNTGRGVTPTTASRGASAAPSTPPAAPPAWKKVFTQNFAMRSGGEDARQYQALFARELQRRWQQTGNWAAGAGSTDYFVMGEYWTRGDQLIVRVDIQRGFAIAKSLQWTIARSELVEGGHFFERMAGEINTHLR